MGPAVRAAAADAARQMIEIAAQRYDKEERILSLKGGNVVCSDGGSWPLEEVVGLLEDARSSARAHADRTRRACRC